MSVPLQEQAFFVTRKLRVWRMVFRLQKKAPFVSERSFCLKEGFFSVCMPAAAHNVCAADDALFHRSVRRYIRRKAS